MRIKMKTEKCVVIKREVTEEDFAQIMAKQRNTKEQNSNFEVSESAFEKALKGSEVYLKAHDKIKES